MAVKGQCEFTVSISNSNDQCLYAAEEVVWSKTGLTIGLSPSGNSIDKTGGTNGWNAGAISVNKVKNNGWLTTTINEVNKARSIGLSTTDGGTGYTTIQYAFSLRNDGQVDVYESGTMKANFNYTTGKELKIAVENNIVKYYYDNQLKYISAVVPTLPLITDISMNEIGSSLRNVQVFNGSDGSFVVSAPAGDLGGAGLAYQWYLNGAAVLGATTSTYTNVNITAGNQLFCKLTPGVGGCSATVVNSNTVYFQIESPARFGNYYISNTAATQACLGATEEVILFTKTNVSSSGNDLTKNYGVTSGSWDAGASSFIKVLDNGYAETTIVETTKTRAFGLSSTDVNLNINTIQYGFFFRGDAQFEIYESGSKASGSSTDPYSTNDIFRIAVESGVTKYYQNGMLKYISSIAPTLPLLVDISFQDLGASIKDVFITNGSTGSFTAIASSVGASPSYQWLLNGVPVGLGNSYSNPSIVNTNTVQCNINPDLVGCSLTTPVLNISSRNYGGTFYISNSPSIIACAATSEQIQPADKINVVTTGNNVSKVQGGSGFWNAGATSLNEVYNNGYAETTIAETTTTRVFGLSSSSRVLTHTDNTENKIQYGIMFFGNAHFWIVEFDGTAFNYRGDFGSFISGDVFRIKVDNGTVRYYKGSTVFYSSAIAPSLPLIVDISFNDLNATLNNIIISNGCLGTFNALASNAGPSPTYQWKVNGIPLGSNTSTYANSSLAASDIITCTLTPDIPGCNVGQNSNLITVDVIGEPLSATTTWNGSVSTAWENSLNWSNGLPTGYLKVVIPSGLPSPTLSSTAGVFDLNIQNGATLTIAASNNLIVFNDWNNQGTFTPNTSKVQLKYCTNNSNSLKVSAAGNTFYDLDINNANGINMTNDHTISHDLKLNNGIVTPSAVANMVIINNGATVTSASTASYISGKVKKIGNSAFSFPVGKSGFYRPISISTPSLIGDSFVAEYFKTGQAFGGSSTWPSALWTVSGCEYWQLVPISGSSTPTVTLNWKSSDCNSTPRVYVTDASNLVVVGFDGTNWKNWGNSSTSGTASAGSITSGNSITSYFGPFTLGSLTNTNALPIKLVKFEAHKLSSDIRLSWITESETNNDYFEIEKSTNGTSFHTLSKITAVGNSNQTNSYAHIDLNPSEKGNYYRLKQVDVDGAFTYSEVVYVNYTLIEGIFAFPNPVKRGQPIDVITSSKKYFIVDALTSGIIKAFEDVNTIETNDFSPGVYILLDDKLNKYKLIIL